MSQCHVINIESIQNVLWFQLAESLDPMECVSFCREEVSSKSEVMHFQAAIGPVVAPPGYSLAAKCFSKSDTDVYDGPAITMM